MSKPEQREAIRAGGEPTNEVGMGLLIEAGAVLATSLNATTTMGQVARLTVPRLADLCVIDLRDEDGSIRDVAVAATETAIATDLEKLRRANPLDPDGTHPVARVIRSGEPQLLPVMSSSELGSFAEGSEHARFMLRHGYRSAVVAPLLARGRTLGALSTLRLGAGEPYDHEDLELVSELARRAAIAIDNARLFSEVRRVERRWESILANIAEAITVVDRDGRMIFANQAAADLLGASTPEALIEAPRGTVMSRFLVLDERGYELDLESMPARRLLRGEDSEPLLVRNIVRATGEERWLNVRSSPVTDPDDDRVLYVVNVFENMTEVKHAQIAETFMAEASRVLASSMDYGDTLRRVVRLAVPQLADWCAVDLLSEHGEIERLALHHVDPAKIALAERLHHGYQPTVDEATGVAQVIRTGESQLFAEIHPDALAGYARDEEHLKLLLAIGATSVIIVPLAGPTKTLGAITLVSSESIRRLSHADLDLAVRLGRRAGTAVENARLYTERTRIAHTLQKALLPEFLPQVPGVEIQALYSAAGELNEVGGDFYDVFEYDPDRWMLVIGDVCGKGPRAAGVTALARHTLRAAAMSSQSPTEMLCTLDQALRRQLPAADFCTVCLVTMQLIDGHARLTIALGGHHPPLLIEEDGQTRPVGRTGTLLGAIEPIRIVEVQAELRAGQTLLLYTDGVTEAGPVGAQMGEPGLFEVCARAPGVGLTELLEQIAQTARDHADGRLRDDIALLGVRLTSTAARADGP